MADSPLPDYYEILQVSPRADNETIERVFRHLAKRYHPDNLDSGNSAKFAELSTAYDILSDPVQRAKYDVNYAHVRETRWKIFNQDSATSEIANDSRIRMAILSLVYVARRNNNLEPEISTEWEAGFETGFLNNKAGIDFTYWNRKVDDVLVAKQFAPSRKGHRCR